MLCVCPGESVSIVNRLLIAVLVLLPLIALLVLKPIVYAFSPSGTLMESTALSKGWALFTCEPPFNTALTPQLEANSECVIRNGSRTLVISGIEPGAVENPQWAAKGAGFEFTTRQTEQFMGQNIVIEIDGYCEGCDRPVIANYSTQGFGNSGWREVEIGAERSVQRFTYTVPDQSANLDRFGVAKPVVVLNPQSADATLYINKVFVRPVR